MPWSLERFYGTGHLHFITCSCYRRQPLLNTPLRRDFFLELLEQTRQRYNFVVVGYVVMPEHFHLLINEPEKGTPSTVMQVVKQRFAKHVLGCLGREQLASCKDKRDDLHIWMERFYDFNVWTSHKRVEKLRYMHENPVKRGLVVEPGEWNWSSFRHYTYDEPGRVTLNQWPPAVMQKRA